MDADLKAALFEQQALQPFFVFFKDIEVPCMRYVAAETQMMMDAGYIREKSFNIIIRISDLVSQDVPIPQVKETVKVLEDLVDSGTKVSYTILESGL